MELRFFLPYQPELVGTSMLVLTDYHGLNVTRIEIALSRLGGGFIYYYYPNPERGMQPEPKVSYVRMVDDTLLDWSWHLLYGRENVFR